MTIRYEIYDFDGAPAVGGRYNDLEDRILSAEAHANLVASGEFTPDEGWTEVWANNVAGDALALIRSATDTCSGAIQTGTPSDDAPCFRIDPYELRRVVVRTNRSLFLRLGV